MSATSAPDKQNTDQPVSSGMNMLDVVALLLRHRLLVLGITGGVVLLSVVFLVATSFLPPDSDWNLLPDTYAPSVRVLLLESSASSGLSQTLAQSGLSGIASIAGLGSASQRSNFDLARDLLQGRNLLDAVAAEFGIAKRYGIDDQQKFRTRQAITKHLKLTYNELSGILEIAYRDTDREYATRIVARIVDLLEAEIMGLTLDMSSRKRAALEIAVATQSLKSDETAAAYVAFQRTYGVLDVATQASELSRSMASVQSQLTAKRLELRVAEQYYPANDARIVKLKVEIEQLEALQRSVREGSSEYPTGGLAQKDLPQLSVQFLALKRDMEIQQSLLGLLKQRLELARLEELDTADIFQVVDNAELPERPSSPDRTLIGLVAAFVGLAVGILAAFVAAYFERAVHSPASAATVDAIRKMLPLRRRSRRRPR